jgi:hypothetical protein
MAPVARSRLHRFIFATAALALAGLVGNACSLNPQPLPPDQPTDAAGLTNSPARAADSGAGNFNGQADATTAAPDSASLPVVEDAAPPAPGADATPDSGGSPGSNRSDGGGDGASGDAHAPADGEADATTDATMDGALPACG